MISVIITTYKRTPEIVCRAIKSVINQTYKDIEIIVVDDSPKDFSDREEVEKTIKDLPAPITYIKHTKNQGACKARNTGLAVARGEYVAFLDDDDEWVENKLEVQIKEAVLHNRDLIYCNHYCFYEDKNEKIKVIHPKVVGNVYRRLLYDNFIGSTSFPLIKKEAIIQAGLFDEGLKSSQDYDMWIRIAKDYSIGYVDDCLVIYHINSEERITINPNNKIQGKERVLEKYYADIAKDKAALWLHEISISYFYAEKGDVIVAIKKWWRAIFLRPFFVKQNIMFFLRIIRGLLRYKRIICFKSNN